MSYIDIAIIVIIVIFAIIGFSRGMLKSILGFVGTIACLIGAYFLTGFLINKLLQVQFFYNIVLGESSLLSWTKGWVPDFGGAVVTDSAESLKTALGEGMGTFIANLVGGMIGLLNADGGYTGMTLQDCVANIVAMGIAYLILFIIIFIILKIIVSVITAIINAARKVKAVKTVDRILGFVFGGASGALFVAVIFAVMSFFISMDFMADFRTELETKSVIAQPINSFVGQLIEDYVDVEILTGGLVKNAPEDHVTTAAETTAANTLNVFYGQNMDMFAQNKYPRPAFTTANYNADVQLKINKIEQFIIDAMSKINAGEYVMEISDIQTGALLIQSMYSNETDGLIVYLDAYSAAKTAGDSEEAAAQLNNIGEKLGEIMTQYEDLYVGTEKIPGLAAFG